MLAKHLRIWLQHLEENEGLYGVGASVARDQTANEEKRGGVDSCMHVVWRVTVCCRVRCCRVAVFVKSALQRSVGGGMLYQK